MEPVAIVSTETPADRLLIVEVIMSRGVDLLGTGLKEIRDDRLYRVTHGTFEAYCKERWGFSRPRAYQLIAAAEAIGILSTNVDKPIRESHVRPLTALPPEQQVSVWEEVVRTAPDSGITGAHVQAVADRMAKPVAEVAAVAVAAVAAPVAPTLTKRQRELAEAAKRRFVDCLRHMEVMAEAVYKAPESDYRKAISVCTPAEIDGLIRAAHLTRGSLNGIAGIFYDLMKKKK